MISAISNTAAQNPFTSQPNVVEKAHHGDSTEKQGAEFRKTEEAKDSQQATENLTHEDQLKVLQLKQRDMEVKAHEQAHLSAAGSLASGGASFTYQTGPNGVRYAVGGEVNISTSEVSEDPAATLKKADAIRRAALAPANPSAQDQMVAGRASSMAGKARVDLVKLSQEQEQTEKAAAVKNLEDDKSEFQTENADASKQVNPSQHHTGTFLNVSV